jgi:dephospho-CoA kinase
MWQPAKELQSAMKTIGLVGGVASGKSRVAQMLVELGAGLLDADRAGHAVLNEDTVVREAILLRWGSDVIAPDGGIDRAAIAKRVFGHSEAERANLEFLESLLHPRIRDRLKSEAQKLASSGIPAVVLDAPLLLEANWRPLCDVVLFVDASRETRLARAQGRGWTDAQFDEREAAQWSIVKKRGAADVVINNDGTEEALRDAVRQFWDRQIANEAH